MEAVLVIATLAQRWRMRLVPGFRAEPRPMITLRQKYGMQMELEERRAATSLRKAAAASEPVKSVE
jgi:hypothetical protein